MKFLIHNTVAEGRRSIFDDDKPKRLSLRERMALKQQQEPKSVLKSPTRILDNPIKKYRQSREIEETVEIETTTRRRVIRFNDDGEEEVSIREKNLKNQTKEDVEREIARKSMTFESLVEEEEENDSNNNTVVITSNKSKNTATEKHAAQKDINGNETKEESVSTVTIEKVVNGNKEVNEVTVHEKRQITNGDVDVTTTERKTRNVIRKTDDDDDDNGESKAEMRRRNRIARRNERIKNEEEENEKLPKSPDLKAQKSPDNNESKTSEKIEIKEEKSTTKDETDSCKNNEEKSRSTSNIADKFANKNDTKDGNKSSRNLRSRFEKNDTNDNNSGDKNTIRNRFERNSLNKRPSGVGDAKSRFENKSSVSKDTANNNKSNRNEDLDSSSKKVTDKNEAPKPVDEDIIATEDTAVVESANVGAVIEVDTKSKGNAGNKTNEKVEISRNNNNNNNTKNSSSVRDRFENDRNSGVSSVKNKRPQSMADFKSKFENKTSTNNGFSNNSPGKRPVSMNIRSKFETGNKKDNDPAPFKSKFELRKTTSTPPATGRRSPAEDNSKDNNKKQVTPISETKTETNNKNTRKEVTTTETNTTKGTGKEKQEIKEIKTVEIEDTKKAHTEKTTTVTNIKTSGGTMTVKKAETKIESKPEHKKVSTRDSSNHKALSVEERLRENKKKQEAAKKAQSANAAKGRNAFKLQLEANKPAQITVGMAPQKSPVGNSNIDKLLSWISKRVNKYPEVNVSNFTSSWADGIALCVLMHYFLGDEKINLAEVTTENKRKNFEMAVAAATEAGVPALVDAGELAACEEMDRRTMITYLHTVYKVLFADKQQKK